MDDRSMNRFAWVLALGGLAGVLEIAQGVGQTVEPPGTAPQPPQKAVEPPRPATKTPMKSAGRPRKAGRGPKMVTNSIGMPFVLVPAGEFLMGSPTWDKDAQADERPQHKVRITRPFFLGACEVTQQEYERVTGMNPSSEQLSPQQPVEMVSWFDAVRFCNRLSEREKVRPYYEIAGDTVTILGGNGYRLPTEAEWEYACRAGSSTKWSCGDDVQLLGLFAWYQGNAGSHAHPVGEKAPNALGLYDMHGHMWEWCWDWYGEDYYRRSPVDDPQGPSSGSLRVERGGDGWNNDPPHLRSAYRDHQTPSLKFQDLGFRVARTSNEPAPAHAVAEVGKQDAPIQILNQRGLERHRGTPPTWILKEERAVLDRFRLVGRQATRLASARDQRRQLAAGGQASQVSIAVCQAQVDALDNAITELDDKIAALGPSVGNVTVDNYYNILVRQRNVIIGERRRLSAMITSFYQQGGNFEELFRQVGKDVDNVEKSHPKLVEELRESLAEINTLYEKLGEDEQIKKALSELTAKTKVKHVLGPSKDLKDATRAVARAADSNRAGTPTEKNRKTN